MRTSSPLFIVLLIAGVGAAYFFRKDLKLLLSGKKLPQFATEEDLPEGFVQDPSANVLSSDIDRALGAARARAYAVARGLENRPEDRNLLSPGRGYAYGRSFLGES